MSFMIVYWQVCALVMADTCTDMQPTLSKLNASNVQLNKSSSESGKKT